MEVMLGGNRFTLPFLRAMEGASELEREMAGQHDSPTEGRVAFDANPTPIDRPRRDWTRLALSSAIAAMFAVGLVASGLTYFASRSAGGAKSGETRLDPDSREEGVLIHPDLPLPGGPHAAEVSAMGPASKDSLGDTPVERRDPVPRRMGIDGPEHTESRPNRLLDNLR